MEEKKDIIKSINILSASNKESLNSLAALNKQTFNMINDSKMQSAIKQLSSSLTSMVSITSSFSNEILDSINKLTDSYKKVFDSFDINKSVLQSMAYEQMNTMMYLKQSVQTEMIESISKCFASARYDSLVDIINDSIKNTVIPASDIGFFRTSGFVNSIKPELDCPKGFVSTLSTLNLFTAKELALDSSIGFDTRNNVFITEQSKGEAKAKGLNIVCSSKNLLNSVDEEAFSISELIDFVSFLSRTPMAALENETGKRIKRLIDDLFHNRTKSISFDKNEYYHCRSHKKDEMEFTFDEMLKAPHGLPWAGRYNHFGISHYYFSDSKEGAQLEVQKHLTSDDILQTIRIIPNRGVILLDLSGTWQRYTIFLKYLRFSLKNNTMKMPREYLLPCFVSDCCKLCGFEGVKYYGSKDYNNYVTWESDYFNYGGICL